MKFGLLKYNSSFNIGDNIQSLAAAQFLPQIDFSIDRDQLNSFQSEEQVKLIMNGWFMQHPENWPPSNAIHPLFVSFHLNSNNNSDSILLSEKNIAYLKNNAPIGCRDYHTLELLQQAGIDAYYSGCLTLTLENKFQERNDSILFVDVLYNYPPVLRKIYFEKIVPEEFRSKIIFIEQDNKELQRDHLKRMREAERLIELYSKAKLVITSRIHCALPCLALGTPVYFINGGLKNKTDITRLKGIVELMRCLEIPSMDYEKRSSIHVKRLKHKIGWDKNEMEIFKSINFEKPEPNPISISVIADQLRQTCKNFIDAK